MRKILLIIGTALMAIGVILFLAIGTPLHNFSCMWAGLGIFLIGLVVLIVDLFFWAYYCRKEKEKDNIKRG